MILIIDNFDSFTYILKDYFLQLGVDCEVIRNDVALETLKNISFEAIIISPGPETPLKAGNLMAIIEEYSNALPILGICLGHQALALHFGATLQKAIKPMHGKISNIHQNDEVMFKGVSEKFNVVRYHSLVIKDLPSELVGTSYSVENELMSFKHNALPLWGLQYHPEAVLSEYGLEVLDNWLRFNKIEKGLQKD